MVGMEKVQIKEIINRLSIPQITEQERYKLSKTFYKEEIDSIETLLCLSHYTKDGVQIKVEEYPEILAYIGTHSTQGIDRIRTRKGEKIAKRRIYQQVGSMLPTEHTGIRISVRVTGFIPNYKNINTWDKQRGKFITVGVLMTRPEVVVPEYLSPYKYRCIVKVGAYYYQARGTDDNQVNIATRCGYIPERVALQSILKAFVQ